MYCPTTCGVADYMVRYFSNTDEEVERMERDLDTIANLTQDAEERVVYMKDSMAAAQKSFKPGKHHKYEPHETPPPIWPPGNIYR